MAHILRVKRSPYWIAGFTLPGGRRTQRSTKTTDRRLAFRIASEWESAARLRITEAQVRLVFSQIHEAIHGAPLSTPTAAEWIAQWLIRKQVEAVPVTVAAYRHATASFQKFLGDHAGQPLHYITTAKVCAWRDHMAAGASARTTNNKLKVIRALLQAAWRDGLIAENPAAKVAALRTVRGNRRPFTLDELRTLVRLASPEWRGMILAGLYTGQRLRDIALMTWENVHLDRGEVVLTTSKTGRHQVVPMAQPLLEYLQSLPRTFTPRTPIFPGAHAVVTRSRDTSPLSQQFHALLVSAGMAQPRPPKRMRQNPTLGRTGARQQNPVTFHSLRHTATSLLKNAGVPEAVAREIIGHDSAEVSRHYTHVGDEAKRAAVEKLPNIVTRTGEFGSQSASARR